MTVLVKPRLRAGTYNVFHRRYEPIVQDADDNCLIEIDVIKQHPGFQKALNENRLWTVVEAEGKFYVVPGWHYVNREGYIICKNPYSEQELSNPGYVY